jgi:hypothetical protein
MSQLRDEAEALAIALELGACDVTEVIAWCDAQLLGEGPPPEPLCDVSLSSGRHPQDVAAMLRQLSGATDNQKVNRLVVTLVDAKMRSDPSRADQIASVLYDMAFWEKIEDPRLNERSARGLGKPSSSRKRATSRSLGNRSSIRCPPLCMRRPSKQTPRGQLSPGRGTARDPRCSGRGNIPRQHCDVIDRDHPCLLKHIHDITCRGFGSL